MSTDLLQDRDERIKAVRAAGGLNGIVHLEVASNDQLRLELEFVQPLPGQAGGVPAAPALGLGQVLIEGGVRVAAPRVLAVQANGRVLRVDVEAAGDFSPYRLRLVASPGSLLPPAGFDPALSSIAFSFKVRCPNPFDCKPVDGETPPPQSLAAIDYLARDWRGLRGLMLDRLRLLAPDWTEHSPVDQQVMLVELLAAAADQLSYYQDAVATEAYLGTARRRPSLRRHARQLDYRVHEGNNARTWVHIAPRPGSDLDGLQPLPAGTPVLTGDAPARLSAEQAAQAVSAGATAFETLHAARLHAAQNEIRFHTWSHALVCLPAGCTAATLRAPSPLGLQVGDALLLEQILDPATGAALHDAARRHVVRLVELRTRSDPLDGTPLVDVLWHDADALPFALPLEARIVGPGGPTLQTTAVARGNLVLADHGYTRHEPDALRPAEVPPTELATRYRPQLRRSGLSFAVPYVDARARAAPASDALRQAAREALPAVRLHDGDSAWQARHDLLASDRLAPDFVVEVEHDGRAALRFGDGVRGRRPSTGLRFAATVRTGNGLAGQVGADVLRQLASDLGDIVELRNPLPAVGAAEPETAETVRRFAPQAFRVQQRAVTEADYAAAAQRHPDVQRARADFRWTGSWYTAVVTVDRRGGAPVLADARFRTELTALLDGLRTMGGDVALRDPRYIPLRLVLQVCLLPGFFAADVHQRLREAFGTGWRRDGQRAFFHPDNFSFGTPLWLSAVYRTALAVPGVRSAQALAFERWGRQATGELAAGLLAVAEAEILRCDTDPNRPENGAIEFQFPGAAR
ncbi:MAG: putative baseplate assembly protein [Burkholderiaceae bacterium]|nr:putative baseplate assembly protein [Burkholderiaceae bacterium]